MMDILTNTLGIILVFFGVAFPTWRHIKRGPSKGDIPIGFLAGVLGIVLIVSPRIISVPTPFGAIRTQALADAGDIAKLKTQAEQQTATINLVAGEATKAKEGAIEANKRATEAALELDRADANLLKEQRLTARERWRLERVERAVLPRSTYVNWSALVTELKAGNFHPFNIALVGRSWEASSFATELMLAFQQANVLGKYIDLSAIPSDAREGMQSSTGAYVTIGYPDGDRLAQMLWQKFQIGGGSMPAALLPPAWAIPTDMNCLIVEENNWAMSPGNGQPGEGFDEHGRPDPAPH